MNECTHAERLSSCPLASLLAISGPVYHWVILNLSLVERDDLLFTLLSYGAGFELSSHDCCVRRGRIAVIVRDCLDQSLYFHNSAV